ncbi:MAG: c-type cytochrome, partial [Caldimonas sp.]
MRHATRLTRASRARLGGAAAVLALLAAAPGLAAAAGGAAVASAPVAASAPTAALARIGRAATPAEVRAWDIDVRADFKGLPPGSGSVAQGEKTWEAKCASCHGAFGESNEFFTPIVGGTSKQDIESGRVHFLSSPGYPHRTTLMRLSKLSTLWDYVHRAMPWNAPKSLTTDEVYGVVAYILNLGEIVPADFTLSDRNIAEVGQRLPNRNGKRPDDDLWRVNGKGDVSNPACMRDCPVEGKLASTLP